MLETRITCDLVSATNTIPCLSTAPFERPNLGFELYKRNLDPLLRHKEMAELFCPIRITRWANEQSQLDSNPENRTLQDYSARLVRKGLHQLFEGKQ
jgi:hypothetical protein